MSKVLIVANIKSNQNLSEAKLWIDGFLKNKEKIENLTDREIIICPSYTLLSTYKLAFSTSSIRLGAQNISSFDEGPYTGEINGKQIRDFADYVIIGHSERRNHFQELDSSLMAKTNMASKYSLDPIFCVQDKGALIPQGVSVIAYEPIFAIGTGNPDTPENADAVAASIKLDKKEYKVLYGGSVTSQNVKSFTLKTNLDGVLVGGASLDPLEFIQIVQNA